MFYKFFKKNKKLLLGFFLFIMIIASLYKSDIFAFKQKDLLKGKVTIDPGHGGIDGGANTSFGLLEKNINLDIALKIKENLQSKNIKVIMTRDKDISLENKSKIEESRYKKDLYARKDIINKSDSNSFISIHMNSNIMDSNCKGPTIYYNPIYNESKRLSEIIAKSIDDNIYKDFMNFKYVKTKIIEEDYYILRETYTPGILIEVGFITNPYDQKLLQSEQYKKEISKAISLGIIKYLKNLDDDLKTGILGF